MEKRTCPHCGADNYLADTRGIWNCHTCKREIPKVEKKTDLCPGCGNPLPPKGNCPICGFCGG